MHSSIKSIDTATLTRVVSSNFTFWFGEHLSWPGVVNKSRVLVSVGGILNHKQVLCYLPDNRERALLLVSTYREIANFSLDYTSPSRDELHEIKILRTHSRFGFLFERKSTTPGLVTVHVPKCFRYEESASEIELGAAQSDVTQFCEVYLSLFQAA